MYGRRKLWLYALILCGLFTAIVIHGESSPNPQTHSIDTDTFHFKLGNGGRIFFNRNTIYLGDSAGLWSWMDTDGIKFYNLEVDSAQAPDPWEVHISSNTNITIGRLFKDGEIELSISVPEDSNSSLRFSCGGRGSPHSITGMDTWAFNSSTSYLNLTAEESCSVLISWMGPHYYWPEPDYPPIPIIAGVNIPPTFHPSFIEFLTDRISIHFNFHLKNRDTIAYTLSLSYQILSDTGENIKKEELEFTVKPDTEIIIPLSFEIPFSKREDPKEFTGTFNISRDGKLIMDPITHSFNITHDPLLSLIYNLAFLGAIAGMVALGYVLLIKRKRRETHGP